MDLTRVHGVGVGVRAGPDRRLPVHLRVLRPLLGLVVDHRRFRLFGFDRG